MPERHRALPLHEDVPPWHRLPAEAVARQLDTSLSHGLSGGEASRRLGLYGSNDLPESAARSPWAILAAQFADFMIVVLLVAALVAGWAGEPQDAIAIVVIVLLNGAIGFAQEWRAEKTLAALRRLGALHATVLRDGQWVRCHAAELVPGDVIQLEAGDVLPADARIVSAMRLQAQESVLTGESAAVEKQAQPVEADCAALGERSSMAYRGTMVTAGRGQGLVVATGIRTELGRIAQLVASAPETRTPLQCRLAQVGRRLAWLVLVVCAILFLAGLARGDAAGPLFLTAVTLAVAAIPEALPIVAAVALALGAGAMARRQALVRRLPAVESLGAVTVICTDKTGTLTQNRMQVEEIFDPVGPDQGKGLTLALSRAMALCNDAQPGVGSPAPGDPTEIALFLAAEASGLAVGSARDDAPRVAEIPFDATRKRMTTLHREGSAYVAYTKGAPESLLDRCGSMATPSGIQPLDRGRVDAQVRAMAERGLRVIGFAQKQWASLPNELEPVLVESHLVFLGLAGLADPLRLEAAGAIAECQSAGIVPIVITGDHPITARAVAAQLGLGADGRAIIDGSELDRLSPEQLQGRVGSVAVFARATPEHKTRIVAALQARGEIVAMTGDGVNDAPALKSADVGVAMGHGGTEVAREASDLVLLDDNFATIVAAVHEGRRIYDNIRKFIRYALTGNCGEIATIFVAPFLGLPLPLLPIQILWVNLVTDGLPGLALASEPGERDLMKRPPRPPGESLFARGLWQHVAWVGLLIAALCLGVHAWAESTGNPSGQTMVFSVLALAQLAHVLAIRSERDSFFGMGPGSNVPLALAVVLTVLLQLAVIYLPALNELFHTRPLQAAELLACFVLAGVVFAAVEGEKALIRAGLLYGPHDGAQGAGGLRR